MARITCRHKHSDGFTLIELSIVLVIIGLIIGGVLIGRDLISAAEVRATIAQIEKYNTAVNTFKTKFNCMPGDCRDAAAYSFSIRGPNRGQGDGNGIIEGYSVVGSADGRYQATGETRVFWRDLSEANLIDGTFPSASSVFLPGGHITGSALNAYFPEAKLGAGNYVYVYSADSIITPGDGLNTTDSTGTTPFFGISGIVELNGANSFPYSLIDGNGLIPVFQALNIDQKIDDAKPLSGTVVVHILQFSMPAPCVDPCAITGSASTCYDNSIPSGQYVYSTRFNQGNSKICGLSFRM